MIDQYKNGGIWTMDTTRNSCRVPETPLLISENEEWLLNKLATTAWRALETLVDWSNDGTSELGRQAGRFANNFPDGITMPPAFRIDAVRTEDGPKIVEIDPITAISLGETTFLIDAWKESGYQVPSGLIDAITQSLDGSALSLELPSQKREYANEVGYLQNKLVSEGVDISSSDDAAAVRLSSFSELAALRKQLNKDGWQSKRNPLWGSLYGLAGKSNLAALISADKTVLPQFLPQLYTVDDLRQLEPGELVVAKPQNGTGSAGVVALSASEATKLSGDWIFQELLTPVTDDFGTGEDLVSRLSIYAGRTGLLGAQVTARCRDGSFTNVHGQSDAIQTTIAIT